MLPSYILTYIITLLCWQDYRTPDGKVLQRDLSNRVLNQAIAFLVECRPLSTSMGNAIKFLKTRASQLEPTLADDKARASLVEDLDGYIQEKIVVADQVLVSKAVEKISDDDVILTYASSSVVYSILVAAHKVCNQPHLPHLSPPLPLLPLAEIVPPTLKVNSICSLSIASELSTETGLRYICALCYELNLG